ncbi:hypothetical protein [Serratia marcescens]|uniref:hypothetical protein n=1 Tax=Serratia marcescens TaxID=615 RepID=UPI0012B6112D|nr:hypothetical protein [Serratia marcescens]MBH3207863.1 hypothetical protein [Serratia marcescens]MDP8744591.1 hypothetical protein [Serratia marcescens]NCI53358.1 hypothetical protein [Serratia marcescens]NDJ05458.1 hypothetical protein [Serratia marcescens]NDJ31886.1 hypothetical protein [Serratia marcescens]
MIKYLALLFSLVISGCISDGSSSYNSALSEINSDNYSKVFIVGKTTKRDVVEILGPADGSGVKNHQGEEESEYSYKKETVFVSVLTPIPIKSETSKRIFFKFYQNGILKEVRYKED